MKDTDELLQRLVVYMLFYVEARDAKSVEDMGKWIHKILSMITGAYSDGFQKASKGAFKSQQEAKREAVEAVLDRLQKLTQSDYYEVDDFALNEAIEAERNKLKEAK